MINRTPSAPRRLSAWRAQADGPAGRTRARRDPPRSSAERSSLATLARMSADENGSTIEDLLGEVGHSSVIGWFGEEACGINGGR